MACPPSPSPRCGRRVGSSTRWILFEKLQAQNVSGSGFGNRAIFVRNMREFFGNIDFIIPITGASGALNPSSFEGDFSFCHVDGGHSRAETFHDLDLAASLLAPGGLAALDDYFNPEFPGVSDGAVEFLVRKPGVLVPVALAYNKVLFQKQPAPFDVNAAFSRAFRPSRTRWWTCGPHRRFSTPIFSALISICTPPLRMPEDHGRGRPSRRSFSRQTPAASARRLVPQCSGRSLPCLARGFPVRRPGPRALLPSVVSRRHSPSAR